MGPVSSCEHVCVLVVACGGNMIMGWAVGKGVPNCSLHHARLLRRLLVARGPLALALSHMDFVVGGVNIHQG